jgi:flagellin-like protein
VQLIAHIIDILPGDAALKKIWRMRKSREAVSPVIATILMVAITVVLAAVLYVMVMGFGTTGNQTPLGSLTTVTKLSPTTYKINFGVVSPDTKFEDCGARIDPVAGSLVPVTTFNNEGMSPSNSVVDIGLADLGDDGKISVGDYLIITTNTNGWAWTDAGDWTITVIFLATGGSICTKVFTVSA